MLFRSFFGSFFQPPKPIKTEEKPQIKPKLYDGKFFNADLIKNQNNFLLTIENKTDANIFIDWTNTEFKEYSFVESFILLTHYRIFSEQHIETIPARCELKKEFSKESLIYLSNTHLETNIQFPKEFEFKIDLATIINGQSQNKKVSLCF